MHCLQSHIELDNEAPAAVTMAEFTDTSLVAP
jgi:hypothetical protein